jgi:hypothetical protein
MHAGMPRNFFRWRNGSKTKKMVKYKASKSPEITLRVVHLPSEMFNDVLYFKEAAESLPTDPNHDFERWRYLRAAIIFSFITIESYINEFIKSSLEKKKLSPSAKKFLENSRRSTSEKLTLGVELITGKEFDIASSEYNNFERLQKTRNKLIHFKGEREIYTRDITIPRVEEAIETVRGLIKKIHELDDTPYPQFIDKKKSFM